MKIAYVTTYDAHDIKSWSGSGYYIGKTLEGISDKVEYIGGMNERFSMLFKGKQLYYRTVLKKNYLRDREPVILKNYSKMAAKMLENIEHDIVFSPGTTPIAFLETKKPIVIWADATFNSVIDFYGAFSNLCRETIENGYTFEKLALEKCSAVIYASDWAANNAIEYYGIKPEKVKVVPFGANILCNRNIDKINGIIGSKDTKKCKLLFLGVDWLRKGGDIAYAVAERLNDSGLETELVVAGCDPDIEGTPPDFVKPVGYISKSTKEGQEKLNKLFSEAHFLILPSRAECYGLVFCEASSFGLPSLATNVGGIPTAVRNNKNGRLFSSDADINEYCKYILEMFDDFRKYKELSLSSFEEYTIRLNWESAGNSVKKILEELL